MSKVLYVGWFGLPETAAGIRVFQIAKLLRESGNNVAFLCLSQPGLKENQEIQYDGFKYIRKRQFESRVKNGVNIFCGVYDLKVIKEIIEIEKPDTVIVYNDKERLTSQIISFCHKFSPFLIVTNTFFLLKSIFLKMKVGTPLYRGSKEIYIIKTA